MRFVNVKKNKIILWWFNILNLFKALDPEDLWIRIRNTAPNPSLFWPDGILALAPAGDQPGQDLLPSFRIGLGSRIKQVCKDLSAALG